MLILRNHSTVLPCLAAGFLMTVLLVLTSCNNEESQPPEKNIPSQEQKEASQFTAQHLRDASLQGQTDRVGQMIKQGVDLNASDEGGRTALMLASFNGHTKTVRLLLDEGARIDDRNAEGRTALIFAASGPFPDAVEQLLGHGADPNAVDGVDGWSALMFAAAEGNKNVVQVD